ncbi:hypothetical protein GN956_G5482 [Arapaima gigas]
MQMEINSTAVQHFPSAQREGTGLDGGLGIRIPPHHILSVALWWGEPVIVTGEASMDIHSAELLMSGYNALT